MQNENTLAVLVFIFVVTLTLGSFIFPGRVFSGSLAGHLIGVIGTIVMSLTLIYSFRKHVQGKRGRKNPLSTHVYYGLIGSLLVALHAGYGFASLIGTLAFLSMLMVVLSGLVGTLLFNRVNQTLKEHKAELRALKDMFRKRKKELNVVACRRVLGLMSAHPHDARSSGIPNEELHEVMEIERCNQLVRIAELVSGLEYETQVFTTTKHIFTLMVQFHVYLAIFLYMMIVVHILTNLYYGLRWIR